MRDLEIGMRGRPRVSRMSLSALARPTLAAVQTSSSDVGTGGTVGAALGAAVGAAVSGAVGAAVGGRGGAGDGGVVMVTFSNTFSKHLHFEFDPATNSVTGCVLYNVHCFDCL